MSANLRDALLQKRPQNRHPERSASQIYRVNSVWGAESKDPDDAYLVDAVRTFSTIQTKEHDSPLRLFMLHNAKIQVVGDAKRKRTCMAAQDVDVAPVHSKTLPFLLSAPGKNRGGPSGTCFRFGKGTIGVGRTSSPGLPSATLRTGSSTPRTQSCVMR